MNIDILESEFLNSDRSRREGVRFYPGIPELQLDLKPVKYRLPKIPMSQAADWQTCFEIWGMISLKFRYPVLHGALSKSERDKRKWDKKRYKMMNDARIDAFMRRLDYDRRTNIVRHIRNGEILDIRVIKELYESNDPAWIAVADKAIAEGQYV
jgi:hypothetical protein